MSMEKSAQTYYATLKSSRAIPSIISTGPILSPGVTADLLIPDLRKPPPSVEPSRPASNKTPTFLGMNSPPPGFLSHPPPLLPVASTQRTETQTLQCNYCQLNPARDVVRCPSCPKYTVILDQDLLLPADIHVVGKVKVEGLLTDGPYVKIFSLGGTIHIPDSLNLAFSHNPDATPKRIDITVTMNFLNTGPKDIFLEKGIPVTRAQLMKLSI